MTLRQRLTVWYAGLLTSIIILLGVVVYGVMRFTLIASLDATLEDTVQQVIHNTRLAVTPEVGQPPKVIVDLPPLDFFRAAGVEVQIWTLEDGKPHLADSSANLVDYSTSLDHSALGSHTDQVYSTILLDGASWRVRTSPIFDAQGDLVGNIQVAGSLALVNQASRELLSVIVVSCGLTIFGSALLSMWLSKRMLQPIEAITRAAATVAETKDLTTRLPWQGPMDELGQLTAVFNHMMVRLQHLFTVQQRFVADVSHELRTPLTAIVGNLELIKRYGVDDASLDAMTSETERMRRLVNDLLMLARADYGGVTVELTPIELDSLIMEVFRHARGLVQKRNLALRIAHVEPLRVNGNSDRLKQAVLNLIDNALKFTPDDGVVTLSLKRQGNYAVMSVTDTGVGIPNEDLSRVFDRFYQSDPSRVRQQGEGFGLGLSITHWIVTAHGGSIHAESDPGKQTTFIIQLPLHESHLHHDPDITHSAATRPRLPVLRRPS
ncbi:MAG: HAMP domain-containing histidine kinase [Armatimonadetes bacterium]|nr:HAMP domain-containing histidine kinase [Anaerolineae bacterium]